MSADDETEQFLDAVLDRAIELLLGGEEPDAALLAGAQTDLVARVRGVIALARSVVPRPNVGAPRIDGYTVITEIGRGGMGAVYLARQERLGGRPVALKVLAGASLSRGGRSRFRRESEAIARLRHPNIVGVHDVIEGSDPPAFAMEWIDGRSLATIIDHVRRESATVPRPNGAAIAAGVRSFVAGEGGGGAMPAPDAIWSPTWTIMVCRVGITIARALAAVHQAGMLHRDVKPSNILVRCDGACDHARHRDVRDRCGSAPEVRCGAARGEGGVAAPDVRRPGDVAPGRSRGRAEAPNFRSSASRCPRPAAG